MAERLSRQLATAVLNFYATTRRDFDGWIGGRAEGRKLETACAREHRFAPLDWRRKDEFGYRIPKIPGSQTTTWIRLVESARESLKV